MENKIETKITNLVYTESICGDKYSILGNGK